MLRKTLTYYRIRVNIIKQLRTVIIKEGYFV